MKQKTHLIFLANPTVKHLQEAHISLKEQWQDPRFQVHSKQAVTFRLPDDIKIWVPDTYFSNAVEKKLGDKVFRIVEESGYVRTNQM